MARIYIFRNEIRLVEETQNNRAIGKGTCLPFAFEPMLYHFLARWTLARSSEIEPIRTLKRFSCQNSINSIIGFKVVGLTIIKRERRANIEQTYNTVLLHFFPRTQRKKNLCKHEARSNRINVSVSYSSFFNNIKKILLSVTLKLHQIATFFYNIYNMYNTFYNIYKWMKIESFFHI